MNTNLCTLILPTYIVPLEGPDMTPGPSCKLQIGRIWADLSVNGHWFVAWKKPAVEEDEGPTWCLLPRVQGLGFREQGLGYRIHGRRSL